MRGEQNKWAYIFTWAASLFSHYTHNIRIEVLLSVSLCFAVYLRFLPPPIARSLSSLFFLSSQHVCPLSVATENYLKD